MRANNAACRRIEQKKNGPSIRVDSVTKRDHGNSSDAVKRL